jgi:nanoRNase/pAp phosphatase (c-di-AMP/oligoRNAs hydrolase)
MVYGYLRDAGIVMDPRTATAICCGVRFDTGDLSSSSNELDTEAFHESFRRADRAMLARINRPVLPHDYYRELHHSLGRARRHGPLVFGLLGRVRNPETVAEMADFFLRMEGCRWSFVGGAFEDNYHLSIRTDLDHGEAYPLMKQILDGTGTFGGRGPVAGAQIPLESGADLERLEQRLQERAIDLVGPDELGETGALEGTRLTRLT